MAHNNSQQMKKIATNWAENTTFNGVPHVLNARNKPKKTFWCLVVLAGVGKYNHSHAATPFEQWKW